MGSANPVRILAPIFWIFLLASSSSSSTVSANERSLVVSQSTTLQLSPGLPVENSPGSKPGSKVVCERVHIHGLSRLNNLKKIAHSVKVKLSQADSNIRLPNVEVCFHRNASLGLGMCPPGRWEKVVKGSWARSMSPFDHKLLDIRMTGSSLEAFEVSIEEEFFLYRTIFLVLGILMLTLASFLSKSLVFYYSSAMTIGVFLVILMILFQGMKLLPTGRKNSLAIFIYSSIVGLGSFLIRFLPGLFRSILGEIGISEDMYNPLAIFVLAFVVLSGAWLGFWVVRKLVLTKDGSIDISTSNFVAWSIRIVAAIMILQSSLDPLLAVEALIFGIIASSILWRLNRLRTHLYKKLFKSSRKNHRKPDLPDSSPSEYNHDEGLTPPPRQLLDSEDYYSTFHKTPEWAKLSKDDLGKITRASTKKALEELVSSPDFSRWAASNAERLTLAPKKDSTRTTGWRKWLSWL